MHTPYRSSRSAVMLIFHDYGNVYRLGCPFRSAATSSVFFHVTTTVTDTGFVTLTVAETKPLRNSGLIYVLRT